MMRQCAWCLRLIDSTGERVSQFPFPKRYEASHGICGICGTLWMEQVTRSSEGQALPPENQHTASRIIRPLQTQSWPTTSSTVTQLVLELQQHERKDASTTLPELSSLLNML